MSSSVITRNWIGLICESFVSSGQLPTWEAAEYLTENLFGDVPNPHFHGCPSPTDAMSFFLKGIYHPIAGTAFRDAGLANETAFHVFIDVSLLGSSAVLIVFFPAEGAPHLLSLEPVRPWNLRFPDVYAFHEWAQARYQEVYANCLALKTGEWHENRPLHVQRGAKKWERTHGGVHTTLRSPSDFNQQSRHSGRSGS